MSNSDTKPTPSLAFSTLKLKTELLENLSSMGYNEMTPIQAQSLPAILAGEDVIGQGKTGSGKTAAFGLGLLNKLDVKRFRIQTLVLCPTRELADQVAQEIRTLARGIHNVKVLTLCGGVPMGPQIGSLEHGAHIIVGTPGRIVDHLDRNRLDLSHLNMLVLDEADRMLEMGFQPQLDAIIEQSPRERQTLLFSATFPEQIQSIAKQIMYNPVMVKAAVTHEKNTIEQHFYQLDDDKSRMQALQLLLLEHKPESAVVFCNTKRETQKVADELEDLGFSVLALHGDLEQRDRDETLLQFANKSACVLVATDVAARGLDIDALDAVFNYHVAYDTEVHIHRIGRTGRAGSKGAAYTFYNDQDGYKIALLEEYLDREITSESLPSLSLLGSAPNAPTMITLQIDGGKKEKLRPGDILGALTGDNGIEGTQVGKILVTDYRAYVAVNRKVANKALSKITSGRIKGKSYRAWLMK
ncbi:ATP-dependent RNA helicase DbpA [Shewanella xiamenensis]|uniref:ATP-dependent RNA helicase DbpA n=1 Tax=Shewanella xiamenensis TaxID=332186 RepID=UPI001C4E41C1|nr:ATP-dependent RNA helicase DbpA [Shewanella xiamenensis]MCT8871929.1 ATP-dependent RNA helicase DbpA [Shewanella xiamenensis]UWH41409.1 ATP-dependent RNA helicase DbpA [Shewanella xiamenensis]